MTSILEPLLLTLNIFHILLWCLKCWLWTCKSWWGTGYLRYECDIVFAQVTWMTDMWHNIQPSFLPKEFALSQNWFLANQLLDFYMTRTLVFNGFRVYRRKSWARIPQDSSTICLLHVASWTCLWEAVIRYSA